MNGTPLTTEQLASLIGSKANSIRTRLCETGSFHGIKPTRLVTGRLLWPSNSLELLRKGGEA